jgi:exosortase
MNFQPKTLSRSTVGLVLGVAALIGWAFFPTFDWMVEKWLNDPQYSHGFLVPVVALFLIYRKLNAKGEWEIPFSITGCALLIAKIARDLSQNRGQWIGKPWPILAGVLLVASLGLRFISGGLLFFQLDALAFLISLIALSMLAGGGKLLKLTAPAIGFLIFMVPLPYEIERNVGGPLKIVATESSTFLLQTLGYPAVPEGNVIRMDEVELGVVDACSGLKMLMTFSCFAAGAVLLLDRTWFEKMMIVLGILPIAVITNVLRITATGVAYTMTSDKGTREIIHDVDGWLMMPVGLGFLAFQLWMLGRLVIRVQPQAVAAPAFGMNVRVDAGESKIPMPHFQASAAMKV